MTRRLLQYLVALAGERQVPWAAAPHPIGALTPDVQNRRIIDVAFRQAGCRVES